MAYSAWLMVPMAAIAVLLPEAAVPVTTIQVAQRLAATPLAAHVAVAQVAVAPGPWLLATWMLGALCAAIWFARQQHDFRSGLGTLHRRPSGLRIADSVDGLPAAFGLLRPVIALPSDFDVRYDSEQCALLLAHERSHIRGDGSRGTASRDALGSQASLSRAGACLPPRPAPATVHNANP